MSGRKALGDLTAALMQGKSGDATGALVDLAKHGNGQAGNGHQMARLAFDIWQRYSGRGKAMGTKPSSETLSEVARWAEGMGPQFHQACTALDYMMLWSECHRYFQSSDLINVRFDAAYFVSYHRDGLRRQLEQCREKVSTTYGVTMFEAILASLADRDRAASLFEAARAANEEFASAPYLDQYTATYFTAEDIRANAEIIAKRRAAVMDSVKPNLETVQGSSDETILLFSCDPFFFSVYFPYWAAMAQYLDPHGIQMHFLLAGGEEETASARAKGLGVLSSLVALRCEQPTGAARNVTFSQVTVPPFVQEPKTFYACVRYLLARTVMEASGSRVIILDMDMTIRSDPTKFCENLRATEDGCMPLLIGSGPASLIPARRYIANTFPVPTGNTGDQVMAHIEDYICLGLSEPTSWTLDQNALAYMVERVQDDGSVELAHLSKSGVPFSQLAPINRVKEIAQRRLEQR